jgi:hypothetical protein
MAAAVGLAAWATPGAVASDHADTAENVNRIGADLTDVFVFPNPSNAANVVLVMDSHGLIPAGQGGNVSFDPQVLYQFKIDNTGDFVEDLVIQLRFVGVGPNQRVLVSGPTRPFLDGTMTVLTRPYPVVGTINTTFSPAAGIKVFAGVRSEPFFFDLNAFYAALPDRMTPLTGHQVDFPSINAANTPQTGGFRPAGQAMDYLSNLNVMSVVVELPKAMLGNGVIRVWETTSLPTGAPNFAYVQQDRLARPVVNEVLATVSFRRHEVNNKDNPTDDAAQLKTDIESFLTVPAGRSAAIKNVIEAVLVPDVLVADLSQNATKAAYLGVETGGATGSKFGGRALADDVVDISLGVVFGNTVPALGLAPDDGKEIPSFTTDNVGPHTDYLDTFPYLGNPH